MHESPLRSWRRSPWRSSPRGADAPPVSFRAEVAPILVRKCLGCHNEKKPEGGLNMTTFALLKAGGEKAGDLILEPGDPDASHLIELVRPGGAPRMPYKLPPLSAQEIRTLERWIRAGGEVRRPLRDRDADRVARRPAGRTCRRSRSRCRPPTRSPRLAFSPDGKMLAAAVGRQVLLFDAVVGQAEGDPGRSPRPGDLAADHPRRRDADRRRRTPGHVRLGHGLGPRQGHAPARPAGPSRRDPRRRPVPRREDAGHRQLRSDPHRSGISPGVSSSAP